jgi:hypothetical protein
MNLVYDNRNQVAKTPKTKEESVLKEWLMINSQPTIQKFIELEKSNFKKPVTINCKKKNPFPIFELSLFF